MLNILFDSNLYFIIFLNDDDDDVLFYLQQPHLALHDDGDGDDHLIMLHLLKHHRLKLQQ